MTPEIAAELVRLRAALSFYQEPWGDRQQADGGRFATEALTTHLYAPKERPSCPS
jgi:hypothetical protein